MLSPTIIRVPRARLLLETAAGSGQFFDHGRIDEATITINGDPTISEEFDPNACVRYESGREYLRLSCAVALTLSSGQAANIAAGLLSSAQTLAAAVGKTFTSPATLSANALLSLGWAPAGTYQNGIFTPDALTTIEDSNGTPQALVLDTDYRWHDARCGIIEVFDPSGFTLPIVVTGDTRATDRAVIAADSGAYRELILVGVDQRNSCRSETVHLWKVSLDTGNPINFSQSLDSDDGVPVELSLMSLEDVARATDGLLGPFGYWEQG